MTRRGKREGNASCRCLRNGYDGHAPRPDCQPATLDVVSGGMARCMCLMLVAVLAVASCRLPHGIPGS